MSRVERGQLIDRLLAVIGTICTSACVTDAIWLADKNGNTDQNITVCEELAHIAYELGATDLQVDSAFNWPMSFAAHKRLAKEILTMNPEFVSEMES